MTDKEIAEELIKYYDNVNTFIGFQIGCVVVDVNVYTAKTQIMCVKHKYYA